MQLNIYNNLQPKYFTFRLASKFRGGEFQNGLFVRKVSSGNVAIFLGYSDLDGFIVESCRQIVDNKVTF